MSRVEWAAHSQMIWALLPDHCKKPLREQPNTEQHLTYDSFATGNLS
jgi:hypothetical protein